jgi:hypothetical protein
MPPRKRKETASSSATGTVRTRRSRIDTAPPKPAPCCVACSAVLSDVFHKWQRLEVLVAVMLARERRALADAEDSGCTELAAALATLPSGLLDSEMVADAVAALGHADV